MSALCINLLAKLVFFYNISFLKNKKLLIIVEKDVTLHPK